MSSPITPKQEPFKYDTILGEKPSLLQKVQFGVAKRVVLDKSPFWTKVSSIFSKTSFFASIKPKLETEYKAWLNKKEITHVKLPAPEKENGAQSEKTDMSPSNPTTTPDTPAPAPVSTPIASEESQSVPTEQPTSSDKQEEPKTEVPAAVKADEPPAEMEQAPVLSNDSEKENSVAKESEASEADIQSTEDAEEEDVLETAETDPASEETATLSAGLEPSQPAQPPTPQQVPVKNPFMEECQVIGETVQRIFNIQPRRPVQQFDDRFSIARSIYHTGTSLFTKPDLTLPLKEKLQKALETGENSEQLLKDLFEEFPDAIEMINQPLPNMDLPIHHAVAQGNIAAIKFLLKLGADPLELNYQKQSALDHAVLLSKPDLEPEIIKTYEEIQELIAQYCLSVLRMLLIFAVKRAQAQNVPNEDLMKVATADPQYVSVFNKLKMVERLPIYDTQVVSLQSIPLLSLSAPALILLQSLAGVTPANSWLAFGLLVYGYTSWSQTNLFSLLSAVQNGNTQLIAHAASGCAIDLTIWTALGLAAGSSSMMSFAKPYVQPFLQSYLPSTIPYVKDTLSTLSWIGSGLGTLGSYVKSGLAAANITIAGSTMLSQLNTISWKDIEHRPKTVLKKTLLSSTLNLFIIKKWLSDPIEEAGKPDRAKFMTVMSNAENRRLITPDQLYIVSKFLFNDENNNCKIAFDALSEGPNKLTDEGIETVLAAFAAAYCPSAIPTPIAAS